MIQLKPRHAIAYYKRASCYVRKKDSDNAIKDYTTVIQLKPRHATAYRQRGLCYDRKGDLDNAIKDY